MNIVLFAELISGHVDKYYFIVLDSETIDFSENRTSINPEIELRPLVVDRDVKKV